MWQDKSKAVNWMGHELLEIKAPFLTVLSLGSLHFVTKITSLEESFKEEKEREKRGRTKQGRKLPPQNKEFSTTSEDP